MNWLDFFRGLVTVFGDRTPLLIVVSLALSSTVSIVWLLTRALREINAEQRKRNSEVNEAVVKPLHALARQIETHRAEQRAEAAEHLRQAQAVAGTLENLRALTDLGLRSLAADLAEVRRQLGSVASLVEDAVARAVRRLRDAEM